MVLLTFSDFIIIRCNLKCRDNPHFHCLYCGTTVLRKAQLEIHLSNCKQKIQSLQKTAAPMVLIGNTPQPSGSAQTAPLLQLQPQPSPSGPHTSVSPTPFTPLSQPQVFKVPPLSSPLSIHTTQPSGSAQTAPLLQLQPQPSPSGPHTYVSPTPFTPLSPKYHAVMNLNGFIQILYVYSMFCLALGPVKMSELLKLVYTFTIKLCQAPI